MMIDDNGTWQRNFDGTWSASVPLPLYTSKWLILPAFQCQCGKKFRLEGDYQQHYTEQHTDGKKYNRTPKGLLEVEADE